MFGDVVDYFASYINVKKLTSTAILPTRGTEQAAGYDLYADIEKDSITIEPHQTVLIGTGLAMKLSRGYFLGIYPRSGLASKKGLRPANTVGIVDSDYRGEIKVALHNDSNEPQTISKGERIAQCVYQKFTEMKFIEVNELDKTERGEGGFGSTDESEWASPQN